MPPPQAPFAIDQRPAIRRQLIAVTDRRGDERGLWLALVPPAGPLEAAAGSLNCWMVLNTEE